MSPAVTNHIQSTWQTISVIGTWVISVAGSFLLPLPLWAANDQSMSYTKFIYFIATVIAGFVLIYTFVNKNKRVWLIISVVSLIALTLLFYKYSVAREALTLHYDSNDYVVGTEYKKEFKNDLKELEALLGHKIDKREILDYASGRPDLVWTPESIKTSRWTLILLLLSSFMASSVFLISFVNTFFLFKQQAQ